MKITNWLMGAILTMGILGTLAGLNPSHLAKADPPVQMTLKLTMPSNHKNTKPKPIPKPNPGQTTAPQYTRQAQSHGSLPSISAKQTEPEETLDRSVSSQENEPQTAIPIDTPELEKPSFSESDLSFRPKLLTGRIPAYPDIYPKPNHSVQVTIRYHVTRSGAVENIQILQHNDPTPDLRFVQSIQRALTSWRFPPGQINNETVEYDVIKEFRFENPRG